MIDDLSLPTIADRAALHRRERQILQSRKWGRITSPDEDLLVLAAETLRAQTDEIERLRKV